jgi:phenylacetate-CoA ligase
MPSVKGAYNKLLLLTSSRLVARSNRNDTLSLARMIERSRLYKPFYLREYEKTQWLPRSDLDKVTAKSLRALIAYAYGNVPYYRRIMRERRIGPEDIRTAGDLTKLPVLTKEIVRGNFDSLVSTAYPPQKRILMKTGGSTGEPLPFYTTPEADEWIWASMLRARTWQGVLTDFRRVVVTAAVKERESWERYERYYSAFDCSDEAFEHLIKEMKAFRPQYVTGYTAYLYLLARYMKERGIGGISPYAVESQTEMLFPFMREPIEEAFQCPVFDHYGCKETTIKACDCSRHEGLHISVENGLLEVVKDGEPVVGETGSFLMTDFRNMAMPLIRYEVGDSGKMSAEPCSCGRSLPLLESILGRTLDILRLPEGRVLPGEFFPYLLNNVSGIIQYQVEQKAVDRITLRIVRSPSFGEDDQRTLLSNISSTLGEDVEANIEYVDSISLTPTGKQKIVVSHVKL